MHFALRIPKGSGSAKKLSDSILENITTHFSITGASPGASSINRPHAAFNYSTNFSAVHLSRRVISQPIFAGQRRRDSNTFAKFGRPAMTAG